MGIFVKGATAPANSPSPLTSQGPFLPSKRSLKTWFTTTRRTAFPVSPPSVMQKFRSGRGSFLQEGILLLQNPERGAVLAGYPTVRQEILGALGLHC